MTDTKIQKALNAVDIYQRWSGDYCVHTKHRFYSVGETQSHLSTVDLENVSWFEVYKDYNYNSNDEMIYYWVACHTAMFETEAEAVSYANSFNFEVTSDIIKSYKEEPLKLAKSLNEEQRLFTSVVLRPDVVDAHGDIYDTEVVEKACHNFMEHCQQSNLQHLVQFEQASVVESYIAPADAELGSGTILKGDWVMTMKVHDDGVWEDCKSGVYTGFSVGCHGQVVDLEDE